MFLVDIDYRALIDEEDLTIVTNADLNTRQTAEAAALEEMQSYLRSKYDVALIFINVRTHNIAVSYNIGDHVVFDDGNGDAIYHALLANINKPPDVNPAEWQLGDLRNPAILMFLVDMILYHLHSSVNPRNIPDLRGIRYDAATTWLKKVRDGMQEPSLPRLDNNAGSIINFNSKTKQVNDW